jgi:hypothetical protein
VEQLTEVGITVSKAVLFPTVIGTVVENGNTCSPVGVLK